MTGDNDFLLALGQVTTALLAVAVGLLSFLVARAVARKRAHDAIYLRNLALVVGTSLYALGCDAVAWWSWCQATHPGELLFGWATSAWLSILFAPPALFATGCAVYYGVELARHGRRTVKGRWRA